jgi:hypothetical protein
MMNKKVKRNNSCERFEPRREEKKNIKGVSSCKNADAIMNLELMACMTFITTSTSKK